MLNQQLPKDKIPILRITTRPTDANPGGDIFGGWLMAQIDIAASLPAFVVAKGRVATVAVKELRFIQPVYVNDLVSFYADVASIGNTSITVAVEVYAQRMREYQVETVKVSDATLVFVAIDEQGHKRLVPK